MKGMTSRQKILLGCFAMALAIVGDFLLGYGTFSMTNDPNVPMGIVASVAPDWRYAASSVLGFLCVPFFAVAALERVGMANRLDSYPGQLSGGQQQRVAIARGLASSPEIIYFDEPTSALDPELIGEVLSVMRQLADEGMTMLVVTHEMDFARNVSSKVLFMEGGSVIEAGPSREFFENPKQPRSREFIRTILEARQ